jgi:alkaline phosphatase
MNYEMKEDFTLRKRLLYSLMAVLLFISAGCAVENNGAASRGDGNVRQMAEGAGQNRGYRSNGGWMIGYSGNRDLVEWQLDEEGPGRQTANRAENGAPIQGSDQNNNGADRQNAATTNQTGSGTKEEKNRQKQQDRIFRDSENADEKSSARDLPNTARIQKNGNAAKKNANKNAKAPKNVILMVGDGMGIGQMEVARLFEYGKEGRLFMETLPHVALAHTYSNNNIVTDSAAAGTALATGQKTNNEMIGVSPEGKEVDSILDKFKQDGKKVGVISTNTATDATPAAFTASVADRWSGQAEVARQQLKNEVDVILGGGRSYFEPARQDGNDLIGQFKEKGYSYASNRDELLKANGDKLLGLFHPSYMNYIVDRDENNSQEPNLPEMTQKAVEVLSKGKGNKGFFLMVEGARIDHAAHAADLTSIWKETVEFDNAVKYATNWAKDNGNTLVIVLADHETMGISATEPMNVEGLKNIGVSPEFIAGKLEKDERSGDYRTDSVRNVFKTYANIDLSDDEISQFNNSTKDPEGKVYPTHQIGWEIGSIIARHHHIGVVSSSVRSESSTGGHTGNLVPIFAYGTGAEVFHGVFDNTDIPKSIASLMGYDL